MGQLDLNQEAESIASDVSKVFAGNSSSSGDASAAYNRFSIEVNTFIKENPTISREQKGTFFNTLSKQLKATELLPVLEIVALHSYHRGQNIERNKLWESADAVIASNDSMADYARAFIEKEAVFGAYVLSPTILPAEFGGTVTMENKISESNLYQQLPRAKEAAKALWQR